MLDRYKNLIEDELNRAIAAGKESYKGLADAMNYSLLGGGKRIRPILVLEFCRISGGDFQKALPVAAAIEMIHTYSLIHDDLPCMDNDDYRRGKLTNHKVFGECTAVLAGDALQAMAYRTALSADLPHENLVKCLRILSENSGLDGMCGGQYLDMLYEGKSTDSMVLDEINGYKTGALLSAACALGVAAAGGSNARMHAAEEFGAKIGLAFQIRDDILDVIGDSSVIGKPVGSDVSSGKNTYAALLGVEECTERIQMLTEEAGSILNSSFNDTGFLIDLAESLINRKA